jgi:hypothetical protein
MVSTKWGKVQNESKLNIGTRKLIEAVYKKTEL